MPQAYIPQASKWPMILMTWSMTNVPIGMRRLPKNEDVKGGTKSD